MDKRIDKIIDRLLDDCLNNGSENLNFSELSEKDLLNLTQIFLEFKYPKKTRTTIMDQDKNAPTIEY